jgi:hypothetical protein
MNPNGDPTYATLEAENARLRARIRELEMRSSRETVDETDDSDRQRRWDEADDRGRDIPDHAANTINRLGRAFMSAEAEMVRASLDAGRAVADEMRGRSDKTRSSRAERDDRERDRDRKSRDSSTLMADLANGIAEAVHQSLELPVRAVDRFMEEFDRERERQRNEDRPRRTRSSRSSVRSENTGTSTSTADIDSEV